jgi:Ran GTPase-activating protein (RanGAP) involved in mRNA processing and transport
LTEEIHKDIEKWYLRDEEEIDLREKDFGKEGLKHLSKHQWDNLVSLNLCNFSPIQRNNFEANTAKYLKREHWKNLVNFDLGGNSIGKEGAQALAQSYMMAIVTSNLWGKLHWK